MAMYQDRQREPALVWALKMGRNKADLKPLDNAAFSTLVKTASEVLCRHEQQLRASLHKSMTITHADGTIPVMLHIIREDIRLIRPGAVMSVIAVLVFAFALWRSLRAVARRRLSRKTAFDDLSFLKK